MYNFTVKSSIHDYEVLFIEDTKKTLQEVLKKGDVIIIDKKVEGLYKEELNDALSNYYHISIDASEQQKSYQGAMPVIQDLIDNGFRKNHRLIAIGGGITQDLTAFMASILRCSNERGSMRPASMAVNSGRVVATSSSIAP